MSRSPEHSENLYKVQRSGSIRKLKHSIERNLISPGRVRPISSNRKTNNINYAFNKFSPSPDNHG